MLWSLFPGWRFRQDEYFVLQGFVVSLSGGADSAAVATLSALIVRRGVESIGLDDDLRARVVLDVDSSLELPIDTAAGIRTSGLLGDQFIALEPGAEDDVLSSGDELEFTESAINLDKLIGAVVHGGIGGDE